MVRHQVKVPQQQKPGQGFVSSREHTPMGTIMQLRICTAVSTRACRFGRVPVSLIAPFAF